MGKWGRRIILAITVTAGTATPALEQPQGCLIAGDSIAYYLGPFTTCMVDARSGLKSAEVIERLHPAQTVIVSAGTNDWNNPQLRQNLEAIRARLAAFQVGRVIWLTSTVPQAAQLISAVAARNGDEVVGFVADIDHIHPDCLRCVANEIFGPRQGGSSDRPRSTSR